MRALTIPLLLAACGGSSVQRETPPPSQSTPATPAKKAINYYDLSDTELEQYCLAGDSEACDTGGFAAEERKDNSRARDFFWAGCNLDYARSCAALARLERDQVERKALEEKACRLGDGGACYTLGNASLDHDRLRDAYRYFKAACDSGAEVFGDQGCDLANKLAEKGWADR